MIKASCPCGGTYESETGYYESDAKNVNDWLILHQACINIRVVGDEMAIKKNTSMTLDWRSGFKFIDESNVDYDKYHFMPTGNIECKVCGYVQAKDVSPQHAADCPNVV